MSPYPPAAMQPGSYLIQGLRLHPVDEKGVLDFLGKTVVEGRQAAILNLNVNCVLQTYRHAWLKQYLCEAPLVFCDGDGIRWGLKILGYNRLPPKITYNVFMWSLAQFCEEQEFSIYLIGAKPGTAQKAANALLRRYPRLKIAGTHHGYFEKVGPENDRIVHAINESAADILIVCFGMPAQEEWLQQNQGKLKVHVLLSGGAALDYVSGELKAAPKWMVHLQAEWLFRLFQEPVRLFVRYILGNPYFLGRVILERVNKGRNANNGNERPGTQ
ncbi:MAG: WecB/TagA/CpsF family glycosyltransferase [Candidatus Omnitrophota bacterium]|nr:WecB/TagA/CpsF family glycosyltransferase [Candidatus Omnitrophota bacterium]